MTLTKTTALGDITVNDSVIAKAIIRSVQTARNKVFLSNQQGRLLGSHSRVSSGDMLDNYIIEEKDEKYRITFHVVLSFGTSIKNVTQTVLDALEKEMSAMFPEYGGELIMKIVGIKSKNIAPRDIEVKREYGPAS